MAAPARAHSRAPWAARAHNRTSPESRRPRQQQQPRAPLAHTPHRVRRRPARRACAVVASGGREGEGAEPEANDLASKLARLIFGGNALNDMEPAGLKRMTKEEWPDQWPPVTDAFAAAVEGDCEEVAAFRPLLKQTQLEFQPLALLYDAQRDGWTEEDFHRRVDGMGACVLVAETDEGTCFGGYNPKGWLGYGDWRDAISAFLFAWPEGQGRGEGQQAAKLPKVGGSGMAIIDEPGSGPSWGPDGLKISLCGRAARSRLGSYYGTMPDGSRSMFGAAKEVPLAAVRIYTGVGTSIGGKAEDYEPNALQWQPGELEAVRGKDKDDGDGCRTSTRDSQSGSAPS